MQLISQELKRYSVKPESLDDLWVLSQVLSVSDIVYATSERKVKIGSSENAKAVRKLIYIELSITKTDFTSSQLRITGTILNETEFTAKGSSHTHTVDLGEILEFKKEQFGVYEKKMLDEAIITKSTKNLLVLFDNSDLIVAEFSGSSFSILFTESGLGSRKGSDVELNENEQKYKFIESLLTKSYAQLIFAGPGFWKESFKNYVQDKIKKNIVSVSFSEVSVQAVPKILAQLSKQGLLEGVKIAREQDWVQKLLEALSKGSKCEYGFDAVSSAITEGRCETLLLTTELISFFKSQNKYSELNSLMQMLEQMRGTIVILDSRNEPSVVLKGLGGIACFLRY
jgi:mRNA surveillance protein pelota